MRGLTALVALATLSFTSLTSALTIPSHEINHNLTDFTAFDKRALPVTETYTNKDSDTHQANFQRLFKEGYRLLSISVHGTGGKGGVRYSAVWIKRDGPEWQATHNRNFAEFSDWLSAQIRAGYAPTLVSASGKGEDAVFMAVMEKNGMSATEAEIFCEVDRKWVMDKESTAWAKGKHIKSFREYGTPEDRKFCAIWHPNPNMNRQTYWSGLNHNDWQIRFDGESSKINWHPSYITESEDKQISAVFDDTYLGSLPYTLHGMTESFLTQEIDKQKKLNRYPIQLSGAGDGNNLRFTAIWAEHDIPATRAWRATGTSTGMKDDAAAIMSGDKLARTFMQAQGIRNAQIAVSKAGTILFERAYTWAEEVRATTQPNHRFLLASVSKMYVAAAVDLCYKLGLLRPDDKVYEVLGYQGQKPTDPRVWDITVKNLVEHTGGDDRAKSFDSIFTMREIALIKGQKTPITLQDYVDWAFMRKLDYDPGKLACNTKADGSGDPNSCYSNQGYAILSLVVEKASGEKYLDLLKHYVTYSTSDLWQTDAKYHLSDPFQQEAIGTGFSALDPTFQWYTAAVHGGSDLLCEVAIGPACMSTSASDLARFAGSHAVMGVGGRSANYFRDGSMDGARTLVGSRNDGLDYAITVNTRYFTNADIPWDMYQKAVAAWLDTNP